MHEGIKALGLIFWGFYCFFATVLCELYYEGWGCYVIFKKTNFLFLDYSKNTPPLF
eukprot:TRINITY_DN6884_c0_g1_i1.p1 TRINITY_DN6884_c0_g1~~TRINITY_DN6884_c0_g1_i1.p1  ORF type:complete len:56 (-),score=0.13 TRINITY_DN6884_c0_g1_i1:117-284(-)